MKLGNVIYDEELINHVQSSLLNYYEFDENSNTQIDNNLPTLIVGWKLVKKILTESLIKFSIEDKRIVTNRLYWEYSFNENKEEYVLGISNFVDNVGFYYNLDKFKYCNLDPLFFQINNFDDLKNVLPKEINGFYKYKLDMVYILKENKITGIDLNSYKFFGFNITEIIDYLTSIVDTSENIFLDDKGSIFSKYKTDMPYFNKLKTYILPLLILNKNS